MKHLALVIGIIFLGIGLAQGLETVVQAPSFNLGSGDNEKIFLDKIKARLSLLSMKQRMLLSRIGHSKMS